MYAYPDTCGSVSNVHDDTSSRVATIAGPPSVSPEAKQSDEFGHETELSPPTALGTASMLHVLAPSVVEMTSGTSEAKFTPTAQQSFVVGQETPFRYDPPVGRDSISQLAPMSVVAATDAMSFPSRSASRWV